MTSAHPRDEVRWHIPAKQMGITLPPGYHILEAPLRLILCIGEQEVNTYPIGVDPKEIETDATADAAKRREPRSSGMIEPQPARPPSTVTESPAGGSSPSPAGPTPGPAPIVRRREAGPKPAEPPAAPSGAPQPMDAPPRPARPAWIPQMGAASLSPMEATSSQRPSEEPQRVVLKSLKMEIAGHVATATAELAHGTRKVTVKSVGPNTEERRLFLAAEATARALTELLPTGYGVVLQDVKVSPEVGEAVFAAVAFLTPGEEQSLLGVARIKDSVYDAAATTVLNAVNRKLGVILPS